MLEQISDYFVSRLKESLLDGKPFICMNKNALPSYFCNPTMIAVSHVLDKNLDEKHQIYYLFEMFKKEMLDKIGNNKESLVSGEIVICFFPMPSAEPYRYYISHDKENATVKDDIKIRFTLYHDFGLNQKTLTVDCVFLMMKINKIFNARTKKEEISYEVVKPKTAVNE